MNITRRILTIAAMIIAIAVASVGEPVEPVEAIEMTVGSTGSPTPKTSLHNIKK